MSESIDVKKRNGRLQKLDINKINLCAARACENLENVSASEVVLDAHVQLYDKITTKEIDKALILSARQKIEKEPNYNFVASKLLLFNIHKEVFGSSVDKEAFEHQYRLAFIRNIKLSVKEGLLNEGLLGFDLKKLSDFGKLMFFVFLLNTFCEFFNTNFESGMSRDIINTFQKPLGSYATLPADLGRENWEI